MTFTCNPGFTRQGPSSSTCGAASRWNPPPPECRKRECPSRVSSADRGESSLLCPLQFTGKAKPGWICPGFPSPTRAASLAGREAETGTWGCCALSEAPGGMGRSEPCGMAGSESRGDFCHSASGQVWDIFTFMVERGAITASHYSCCSHVRVDPCQTLRCVCRTVGTEITASNSFQVQLHL